MSCSLFGCDFGFRCYILSFFLPPHTYKHFSSPLTGKKKHIPNDILAIHSRLTAHLPILFLFLFIQCLFNRWGIGSARNSVGMLLLVWKHAPHWNYTVAYGSGWADGEGRTAYMDYELRTLMADQIIPKFKSSEFHLGKTLTSGIAGLATMSRRLWQRQKESSAAMKVVRHSFVPSTGSVGVTPLGPDGMPLPAEEAAATAGAPSLAPTAVTAFLVGGMCAKCQCKVCAPAAAAGLVTPSQAASLTSSVSALSPGTADPTAWQGLSAADEKAAKERLLKHFHKSVLRWPLAPIQGDWYQCVVDTAGLLRPDAIRTITRISEAGLESKRAPVVVVTLQDVAGASHQNLGTRMHRFARDMFNAWGIGEPTFHRGLLLLICKEQSSATVMLGRGWIRSMYDMTDAIIAKTLLPTLEQTRDWSVAISRAVEDLDNLLLAKTNSVPSSSGTQALTPYMGGVTR